MFLCCLLCFQPWRTPYQVCLLNPKPLDFKVFHICAHFVLVLERLPNQFHFHAIIYSFLYLYTLLPVNKPWHNSRFLRINNYTYL